MRVVRTDRMLREPGVGPGVVTFIRTGMVLLDNMTPLIDVGRCIAHATIGSVTLSSRIIGSSYGRQQTQTSQPLGGIRLSPR